MFHPSVLRQLSPVAAKVYLALILQIDPDHPALQFPIVRIMDLTDLSRSTVKFAIRQLMTLGLLKRLARRYHAPSVYILTDPCTDSEGQPADLPSNHSASQSQPADHFAAHTPAQSQPAAPDAPYASTHGRPAALQRNPTPQSQPADHSLTLLHTQSQPTDPFSATDPFGDPNIVKLLSSLCSPEQKAALLHAALAAQAAAQRAQLRLTN